MARHMLGGALTLAVVSYAQRAAADAPFDRPLAAYLLVGAPTAVGHLGVALEIAPSRYFAVEAACGAALAVRTGGIDKEARGQLAIGGRARWPIREWMAVTLGVGYGAGAESTVSTGDSQVAARWDAAHRITFEGAFEMRPRNATGPAIRLFMGWAQTMNAPTGCSGATGDTCNDAATGWPLFGVAIGGAFPKTT